MIIGFDIDGCMCDDHAFRLEQWGKYTFEHGLPVMDKPYGYEWKIAYMDRWSNRDIMQSFQFEYIENVPPRFFVAEVMQKLHDDGHYLIVCTGRTGSLREDERGHRIRETTENWLRKNGIYYDELMFTGFPKIDYVRGKHCDLFVEDAPFTVDTMSLEIPVLLFDNPYNQDYTRENVTRVYSWYDIYRYVKGNK